jgi:hypothetical protein
MDDKWLGIVVWLLVRGGTMSDAACEYLACSSATWKDGWPPFSCSVVRRSCYCCSSCNFKRAARLLSVFFLPYICASMPEDFRRLAWVRLLVCSFLVTLFGLWKVAKVLSIFCFILTVRLES